MVTIQDYIDNNDNIQVRIAKKFSQDPCDPLTERLWEGMLYDVPKEFRTLEVIGEGWLMDAQVNQLEVFTGV